MWYKLHNSIPSQSMCRQSTSQYLTPSFIFYLIYCMSICNCLCNFSDQKSYKTKEKWKIQCKRLIRDLRRFWAGGQLAPQHLLWSSTNTSIHPYILHLFLHYFLSHPTYPVLDTTSPGCVWHTFSQCNRKREYICRNFGIWGEIASC